MTRRLMISFPLAMALLLPVGCNFRHPPVRDLPGTCTVGVDCEEEPDPAPDEPTSCEEHPEPYEGDLPCGFVDGIPVGADG